MSDSLSLLPYSKKSLFIRLNDPDEYSKWDKILSRLGAVKNNSLDNPGWLLAKDKQDLFDDALAQYGSRKRSKRSRDRKPMREEDKRKYNESVESPIRKGSRFRNTKRYEPDPLDRSISTDRREAKEQRDSPEDNSRRYSTNSEDESDSSESDELIQTVLSKRLKSESSHKSIEEEDILDSNDEDCVSYSRRLRHLYTVIKDQRERIRVLEEKINKNNIIT